MNYKNSITDPSMSANFADALAQWGAVRDPQGYAHWSFTPVADPSMSNPLGFQAFSNYPTRLEERDRAGYGDTETALDAYNRIFFHMEYIKPRPQFRPFPAPGTPGLQLTNVERTFDFTVPVVPRWFIASHEIAHILTLKHTSHVNSQSSIMCIGRDLPGGGIQFGGLLAWFVNGRTSPSDKDKEIVLNFAFPFRL